MEHLRGSASAINISSAHRPTQARHIARTGRVDAERASRATLAGIPGDQSRLGRAALAAGHETIGSRRDALGPAGRRRPGVAGRVRQRRAAVVDARAGSAEETAVRLALGASSTRLLREFFFESALLALLGGAIGAVIAVAGLRLLPSLTTDLPRLREVSFDFGALLFIAAVTALSAILSGLAAGVEGHRGGALRRALVRQLARHRKASSDMLCATSSSSPRWQWRWC